LVYLDYLHPSLRPTRGSGKMARKDTSNAEEVLGKEIHQNFTEGF